MSIRRLVPDDATLYLALRLQGLRETPTAFNSTAEEEAAVPLESIAARLTAKPDGGIWGHFDGDALAGIVGVQQERQKQLAHKALIWGMYVGPAYRRRGVARALMTRAIAYATDTLQVRSINLGVNTRNAGAIALYRDLGFEVYGTERGYLLVDGVLQDEHFMGLQVARPARR